MNEIEKMYKTCNIKKYRLLDRGHKLKWVYPPFTAEKQLFLIQWLLDKTDLYLHRNKSDFTYSIATGDIAVNKYKCFNESIAELINAIWQDLTEEEKTNIKNILEM